VYVCEFIFSYKYENIPMNESINQSINE